MSNSPNLTSDASYGLRAGALSQVEIIAQSMANISPTAGPAMVVPLVIAGSGDAACITFLVATAGVILISLNINLLARSSASPGSLYGLVREHFGRWPCIVAGRSLLIAYIGTAAAVTGGLTDYFHALVSPSPQLSSDIAISIAVTIVRHGDNSSKWIAGPCALLLGSILACKFKAAHNQPLAYYWKMGRETSNCSCVENAPKI
jgi:amino acid transporter